MDRNNLKLNLKDTDEYLIIKYSSSNKMSTSITERSGAMGLGIASVGGALLYADIAINGPKDTVYERFKNNYLRILSVGAVLMLTHFAVEGFSRAF